MAGVEGHVLDGKYRIERGLGRGGMGAVYLATHLGTGRPVALKVIAPGLTASPEMLERFRREARAAGRLRHPNIVDVTDFGNAEIDGRPCAYLVMEYLDGCSLRDVLRQSQRLPIAWVADVLEQVSLAVAEAHAKGVLHRDLKPDNIWLEPDRRGGFTAKVLDFGLAKLAEPAPAVLRAASSLSVTTADGESTIIQPTGGAEGTDWGERETAPPGGETVTAEGAGALTRAGAILGTPAYMAPEQCKGLPIDARGDIYSLGVVAYEMLAGRLPFSGSAPELLSKHAREDPPRLRDFRPDVPASVEALVLSALAKDPSLRPASASAFGNALRARAEGAGTLLRAGLALYGEHTPAFLRISLAGHLPLFAAMTACFVGSVLAGTSGRPPAHGPATSVAIALLFLASGLIATAINVGLFVPVLVQALVAPLRPVRVDAVFSVFRRHAGRFALTCAWFYAGAWPAHFLAILPFAVYQWGASPRAMAAYAAMLAVAAAASYQMVLSCLFAPVVILEGLSGAAALRRARELLGGRAFRGAAARPLPLVAILVVSSAMSSAGAAGLFVWGVEETGAAAAAGDVGRLVGLAAAASLAVAMSAVANPVLAIVLALFYLKQRQAGGESLGDALGPEFATEATGAAPWLRLTP